MELKKNLLATAIAATLTATVSTSSQASPPVDMTFTGLFTMLNQVNNVLRNTSEPYYSDPTWTHGSRSEITGTLSYNDNLGYGTATIEPFEFFHGGPVVISNFDLKSAGGGLLIGNMNFSWNGSDITTQMVVNASGLLNAIDLGLTAIDTNSCANSILNCALPGSNDVDGVNGGDISIGPVPIATTTLNTSGQTGFGTTLSQLSLGTDDAIGGSPMDNGPFEGVSINFDLTSIQNINIVEIPVPTAVWLFGSGLIGLISVGRRKSKVNQ